LHLPEGNRNIKIEFLSVYLADPRGVRYQYRLKGLNEDWSATTTDNNVIYSHLGAGNYTFEVRCSADGIRWSEATAKVSFYMPPFWWQTWWFITLLVISTVIVLWLLSRYYIGLRWKQQMRRLEKQLAIEQERHRISGEIHDDLGAGLSGIRLQAELASRKASTPEMKAELARIYNVASELSARMREVIWSLNTENDTLEKLLYYMQQEGYKLFEHTDIQFRAAYPAQLPHIPVSGQKRRDIYLIVKEALHNAMKHSGATEISLTATLQQHTLLITAQDNGKGIGQPLEEEGNGMRNMQQRATKTGGHLHIDTDHGVAVQLSIDITSLAKH
jgi:nitrate/nitrite-specific signal transduction histidine kinase